MKRTERVRVRFSHSRARMRAQSAHSSDDRRIRGSTVIYQLFDIGDAIELERGLSLPAPSVPARTRPERVEAQALQIANPPVAVAVRSQSIMVDGTECRASLSARFFDFGVCSLQLELVPNTDLTWSAFVHFA